MSMKDSFRQAGALTEFYGQLETIIKRCQDILIWQTDEQGKRVKQTARVVSYSANEDQTLINLGADSFDAFKKKLNIFIYDEDDGILFKGKFLRYDQKLLVLRADENVFLREKRHFDRWHFQYTKVFVDVQYGGRIDFHDLLLKDISEDGYGLMVTESKSKALLVGMELGITKIHNIELPRPLEGKIIHRSVLEQHEDPKRTKIKLGVKFNKKSKLVNLVMKAMDE